MQLGIDNELKGFIIKVYKNTRGLGKKIEGI